MSTGLAACLASSCITLHGRPAGLTRVGEHQASTTSAMGSSTAITRSSKGERRLLARAAGEQRPHGEEAGPSDLVCTRSSGGWLGGGAKWTMQCYGRGSQAMTMVPERDKFSGVKVSCEELAEVERPRRVAASPTWLWWRVC